MADLNKVFLMGNLTKEPEIRYTPNGKAVGDLRMAINRRFKTAEGQAKEEACFVQVVVWGRQAETCGEYLRKGSQVLVEGRLQYDEWEKDNQKFSRLRVVADRVQFMGSPRGGQRDSNAAQAGKETESAGENAGVPAESGDEDNLPF